jgi:hypothetical protein
MSDTRRADEVARAARSIHEVPNRPRSMAKRPAKNVSSNVMKIWPPVGSAPGRSAPMSAAPRNSTCASRAFFANSGSKPGRGFSSCRIVIVTLPPRYCS